MQEKIYYDDELINDPGLVFFASFLGESNIVPDSCFSV